jgi:hypothetical protein
MKLPILTAIILAASASFAMAADDITDKVMKDNPGVTGDGTTANPTSNPDNKSLTGKAMKDHPGVNAK